MQPGVGRTPFTNTGNYRVQDNRTDVPATARSVTEFGAACDAREVYGYLTSGSTAFSIGGGALTSADMGRSIVAVGQVGGMPTQFESAIISESPTRAWHADHRSAIHAGDAHQMDLGHDDTAAIAQGMSAVGGGDAGLPRRRLPDPHANSQGAKSDRAGFQFADRRFPGRGYLRRQIPARGQAIAGRGAHPRSDVSGGWAHRRYAAVADINDSAPRPRQRSTGRLRRGQG